MPLTLIVFFNFKVMIMLIVNIFMKYIPRIIIKVILSSFGTAF